MDIFEINRKLRLEYVGDFYLKMREDGDCYIFLKIGDKWELNISFDTLAEFVSYINGIPE